MFSVQGYDVLKRIADVIGKSDMVNLKHLSGYVNFKKICLFIDSKVSAFSIRYS